MTEPEAREALSVIYEQLSYDQRIILNKMIMGTFRLSIPRPVLAKALALVLGKTEKHWMIQLVKDWHFTAASIADWKTVKVDDQFQPYPFMEIPKRPFIKADIGHWDDWLIERDWQGIRVQVVINEGRLGVWTEKGELITEKFPELQSLLSAFPWPVVLEGVIIPFSEARRSLKSNLLTRLSRKRISPKLMRETPCALVLTDVLSIKGNEMLDLPLEERRKSLNGLIEALEEMVPVLLSDTFRPKDEAALNVIRNESRKYASQGLLLKRKSDLYQWENKANWLQWPADPFLFYGTLLYISRGASFGSSTAVEFSLAVKSVETLVPVAKLIAQLPDEDMDEIIAYAKENTLERFGPVRSLAPGLVFQLSVADVEPSSRHKSGIKLIHPKIVNWEKEKTLADLTDLSTLKGWLSAYI